MRINALNVLSPAVAAVLLAGCSPRYSVTETRTLREARDGHQTVLIRKEQDGSPVETPPKSLFHLVGYPSATGTLPAYISKKPGPDEKYPAIIWLVGGFGNSISSIAWTEMPKDNDQSGSVWWLNGVVTMYPSLRGGNENPGHKEGFFGEVDDIIAAARYLKTGPYVDPDRVYLGGHSTGGTLALLVAESTDEFRGVFAFGPTDHIAGYGKENLPFNLSSDLECKLRSPIFWLHGITTPTYVFEGSDGNVDSLHAIARYGQGNPHICTYALQGYDHFNILYPISAMLSGKVKSSPDGNLSITQQEVERQLRVAP